MAGDDKDAKATEAEVKDAKVTDAKVTDAKAEPAKSGGTRPGDAKPEVVRLGDARPDEAKPAADHPTADSEWTASDSRGPLSSADAADAAPASTENTAPRYRPVAPPGTTSAAGDTPLGTSHQAAAAAVAPSTRGSLWPVAAGLIVGALIGAGSAALYDYTQGDTSAKAQLDALNARVDGLEKRPDPQGQLDALKTSVADLGAKVAALPKTPPIPKTPAFDPGPLQDKLGTLEASVAALQKQSAGDNGLASAVETIKQQGTDLKQQNVDLKGLDDKVAGLAAAVAGLQKQDASAKATIDTLQSTQKSLEGKAAAPSLAVAADSLVQQIDRGEPYTAQVDALAGLGADPAKVAVLRENAGTGVPSAKTLAAKFAPLADPITALAYRPKPNAGLVDRLKSGVFSMVSVRRVDDTSGNDLGSRVSRIEADLAHDDVGDAYATWNALPVDAKAKSEAWGALAKTHAEAMQAARALQQQAIAALAAKKS